MNDLLKEKLQPFIQTVMGKATDGIGECVHKANVAVEDWQAEWGIAPTHPLLDTGVQERIRLLIQGEEVHEPTKLELTVAGKQLEKVINELLRS